MATSELKIEEDMKKDDFLFKLLTEETFTKDKVKEILVNLTKEATETPENLSTIITIQHKMYVLANYNDKQHTIIPDHSRVELIKFVFNNQFSQYVKQITEITERIKKNAVYFNNAALGKIDWFSLNNNPVRGFTQKVDKIEYEEKKAADKAEKEEAKAVERDRLATEKAAKEMAAAAEVKRKKDLAEALKEKLAEQNKAIRRARNKRDKTISYKNALTQFYINQLQIEPQPDSIAFKKGKSLNKVLYISTLNKDNLEVEEITLTGNATSGKMPGVPPTFITTTFTNSTGTEYNRDSISPYNKEVDEGLKQIKAALNSTSIDDDDKDNKEVAQSVLRTFIEDKDTINTDLNSYKLFLANITGVNSQITKVKNEYTAFNKKIRKKDSEKTDVEYRTYTALVAETESITRTIYTLYNTLKSIKSTNTNFNFKNVKELFNKIKELQNNVEEINKNLLELYISVIKEIKEKLEAAVPDATAAEAEAAEAEAKRAVMELAEARDAKADNERIFAEVKARAEAKEAAAAEVGLSKPQPSPQSPPPPPQSSSTLVQSQSSQPPFGQLPDSSVKSSFEEIKTDMEVVTNIEEIKQQLQTLYASLDELILQSSQDTTKISEKLKEYLEILKNLNNKILEARTIKITAYYLTNKGETGFNTSSIQLIIQMYDTFFAEFEAIHQRYLINYVNAFESSEDKNLFLNLLKDMYKEIVYQDAARASIAYDMIKDIEPDSSRKQLATKANDKIIKNLADILQYVVAKPDSLSPTLTDQVIEIFSSLYKFFVETEIVVSTIALIKFPNNKDQGKAIINQLMKEVADGNEKLTEIKKMEEDTPAANLADANRAVARVVAVDEEEDDTADGAPEGNNSDANPAVARVVAVDEEEDDTADGAPEGNNSNANPAAAAAEEADRVAAGAAEEEDDAVNSDDNDAKVNALAQKIATNYKAKKARAALQNPAQLSAPAAVMATQPTPAEVAKSNHPDVANNIQSMKDNVNEILDQIDELYDDTTRLFDPANLGANAGVKKTDPRFISVNTFMQKYKETKTSIEAITTESEQQLFSGELAQITTKLETVRQGNTMTPKAKFDFITTKLGQRVTNLRVNPTGFGKLGIGNFGMDWAGYAGQETAREAIPDDDISPAGDQTAQNAALTPGDQTAQNATPPPGDPSQIGGGTRGGRTRRGRKRFHKKTFKKKRFNRKTFKKKRFNRNTGNKKTFKKKTGNNKRVNNKTGNNKRVNNKTGNNKRVNNKTGNNKRVNNKTGNNKKVNKKIVNNKTIHKNHFKRKQTHKNN
jgi:hypothetical protein